MKLKDLDAELLKLEGERGFRTDATMAEAQGVMFDCPACTVAAPSNPRRGIHKVICWFRGRGVPDSMTPGPGRWDASGTGIADLTLSPSVLLPGEGCGWHGWVKNGDAT